MGVYFVQHAPDGLIKIGWSSNGPVKRLATMQNGSPVPLVLRSYVECDHWCEGEIHSLFAASRSHAEWFQPTEDLLAFIASINAGEPLDLSESPLAIIRDWLWENDNLVGKIARMTGLDHAALRSIAAGESGAPKPSTVAAIQAAMASLNEAA